MAGIVLWAFIMALLPVALGLVWKLFSVAGGWAQTRQSMAHGGAEQEPVLHR